MSKLEIIYNPANPQSKARLWGILRKMSCPHRLTICKYHKRRSDQQNRYYWGVLVKLFAQFLRDQGESYTDHDAHEVLKAKFLRYSIVNKQTGELIGESCKSTGDLLTPEFTEYLEKCVAWLADMFGIVCPMPNEIIPQSAGDAD